MTETLSKDQIAAIAANLHFPTECFIGGEYTGSKSGKSFETINPATGRVITNIGAGDKADVDHAVASARTAFENGSWSQMHPGERKAVLLRLVALIGENSHELAVLESVESGKPIKDCLSIDLPETMSCIQWHAEATDKIYDQLSPSGSDAVGMIVREPVGVVACVLPWNFPLMMLAWKIGPALATGNSVIIKPAEQTSMTSLRVAELAIEAGVPAGVFNVVTGMGETAGQAIGLHPDIDVISFTGSTEVGRMFLEYSARSNLKRVTLECGGKSPSVVLSDATNLDSVASHVVGAVFWNMGQNCTANSRFIVHESLQEEMMERIAGKVGEWTTGDPLDPENALGAMITQEHFDKVMGDIGTAKAQGAKIVCGGDSIKLGYGLYISPTIFSDVTPDMDISRDEIFGPVLAVIPVADDEEAIRVANDTSYGLQASLFTSDLRKAHRYSRQIKAGTVSVNSYSEGDITTPFGGYKLSGFGGRDNSLMAHDQYSQTKTIWIDLTE